MIGSERISVSKTKYSLFLKPRKKEDTPLFLPKLKINNEITIRMFKISRSITK